MEIFSQIMQPNKVICPSSTTVIVWGQVVSSQIVKITLIRKYFKSYAQINKTIKKYEIMAFINEISMKYGLYQWDSRTWSGNNYMSKEREQLAQLFYRR